MTRISVTQGVMDITIEMTATDCASCLVAFCVPSRFMKERREDKHLFYCPNGHPMSYNQSKADELTDKLKREQRLREQAEADATFWRDQNTAAERSLSAKRGVITKLKKRAIAGACPFGCKRHFASVERHVARVHPDAVFPGETDDPG